MMKQTLSFALALVVSVSGLADARPLPQRGGTQYSTTVITPPPTGGTQACDGGGSGVCAKYQSGQTFVTWSDLATGAAGNVYRYKVVRSTAPINSGNYASATEIASSITNNSAQLFGGDPASSGANYFSQTYRQDSTHPMSRLSDLGTPLPVWSGLQVHTATANEDAYYAVIAVSGGVNTYIGSVGPIAETIAPIAGIKQYDSLARGQTFGKITTPAGLPVIIKAHQSGGSNGCISQDCIYGDYWAFWMPADSSTWQEGRPLNLDVAQDNAQHYPAVPHSLELMMRDTVLDPAGNVGIETFHQGIGMSPNPAVGPANRIYQGTGKAYGRMFAWTCARYGADCNAIHWQGQSMGAWGGANTAVRMTSPHLASAWLGHPVWRMDLRSSGGWAGNTWSASMLFKATLGTAPSTLGSVASNVLTGDGARWGGAGGFADTPNFIAATPGNDMPFVGWAITKDDPYPTWAEQKDASDAFQSAHRGYAWVWSMGAHETGSPARGTIDCDFAGALAGICYNKALFKLNLPYIAFGNSSIDDDPGTATLDANGIWDGDPTGCRNCGFTWAVTTDATRNLAFTVGNGWMSRQPTPVPTTTITGSIPSTGGGTVTVTNGAAFQPVTGAANFYFRIGNEIVTVTSVVGNTITYSLRGFGNTSPQAHISGETIRQYLHQATGPNGGPYTTMTADVTPRRLQNFKPANGTIAACTVTPFGGSATPVSATIANGLLTLPAITIKSTGTTNVSCSY